MNSIYSSRPVASTPTPRLSTRIASVLLHGAAAFVVVYAGASTSTAPLAADTEPLTFVNFTPPEPPPPPDPLPPVPKEVLLSEPLPPPPIKEVEPELVLAREEPELEPVPEIVPTPVIPEPPRRQPPVVQVGAFASAMASAPAGPAKAIEDAGFDRADVRTSERSKAGAVVGAFDSAATETARPGTGRAAGVTDAGFGSGTSAPAGRNGSGRGVASSGFDSGSAAAAAPRAARVQASTFDARDTATTTTHVSQTVKQTPIEILSKPVPAYTDEARALKVEGEVTLEVEFAASGSIEVLRVVRGLGHGLDEMAARAVQAMRFKPAQREGQPVTTRTTVTIVFRLA